MSRKNPSELLLDKSSSKERAARLRCMRAMTGKPREYFQKNYGIARGTLQNWESDRHGGLTEKGAQIILRALVAENVSCDPSWLLHGVGNGPHFINKSCNLDYRTDGSIITKELLFFRKSNDQATDFIIKDHSMSPIYMPGDYVCGQKYYLENIKKLCGQVVIAQTTEHGELLRLLKAGDEIGLFHLYSINTEGSFDNQMLNNVELLSAAPVTWHRKPDYHISKEVRQQTQAIEEAELA
jgi:hypothetical protein